MDTPSLCPDEPFRLNSVRRLQLIDTPIEERFERITRLAQNALDVPIAAISLVDAERQWFKSIQGLAVAETTRNMSFCGHTILQEGGMVIPDAREDPRFADNPFVTDEPHIVFYAGRPIHGPDGGVVGALCVIDRTPRELDDKAISTLHDLATMVERELSLMVMNTVQQEMITQVPTEERRTLVDPLTRLWNRDGVLRMLDGGLYAVDDGSALVIADIDQFRQINQSLGNPTGDEVLRQVSRRLLGAMREIDSIGRYGDDAFLIVSGSLATREEAVTVAEALRQKVNETTIPHGRHTIDATISIGLAWQPAGMYIEMDDALAVAEAALASAQQDGGNRVVVLDATDGSQSKAAAA